MTARTMWMVRAGRDACWIDDFRDRGRVAIGWHFSAPLADFRDRGAIELEIEGIHPDMTARQRRTAASQLDRFRAKFAIGDRVITYDPARRTYLVGTITSECRSPADNAHLRGNFLETTSRISRKVTSACRRRSPLP